MIDHSLYKDEIDLTKKYSDKPDQLANLLKNAPTIQCSIKKIKMYADPEYEVVNTQEELESRKGRVR